METIQDPKKSQCLSSINRDLMPLKIVYFVYVSSIAVIRAYLGLFMYDIGLNPFQVGILRSLEPVASFLLSPIWGSLADKFRIRKFFLTVCALGSAIFLPMLLLVPPVPSMADEKGEGYASTSTNRSQEQGHLSIGMGHTGPDAASSGKGYLFPVESIQTFLLTGVISSIDNFFIAGFLPLLDAHTMELIEKHPGATYGGQRWPGSLAVIIFSPISGFLMDWYGGRGNPFLPTFVLFGLLMVITTIPVHLMESAPSQRQPVSMTGELWIIFSDFHIVFTFVVYVTVGACNGVVIGFLFIYLEDLGAPPSLMGLSLMVTCLVEVPCLLVSGAVIKRLGYEAVLCVGLLAYAIRLFGYPMLSNPWFVLPIETLHGACYGLLWPACTEYAKHLAPEGMTSTLQSLTHGARAGLGRVIGIAVGGLVYDLFGARTLFLGSADIAMVVLTLYMLESLRGRHYQKSSKTSPD